MSVVIIEIFICIGFIILFYHCCVKGARIARDAQEDNMLRTANQNHDNDLRRFRERMSERDAAGDGGETSRSQRGGSGAAADNRKELIEKNLFSRVIHREESVKELSQLLAISRGVGDGVVDVDEELGECAGPTSDPQPSSLEIKPDITASLSSDSSLPPASAPPQAVSPQSSERAGGARTTSVDTIATAITSQPTTTPPITTDAAIPTSNNNTVPHAKNNNPIPPLEPMIRNLWTNFTHNLQGSERDATAAAAPSSAPNNNNNVCSPASNNNQQNNIFTHSNKIECSICLDEYSPNDTIAWAKDGGDPPTSWSARLNGTSSNNNENAGCDHIFHKGCITAWLQDHDECPLCRRRVVHSDADVRFAGWEEMGQ
mmetsp:Transcript_41926/g.88018  ORF Transcript_41926/g.88018 Transcript_41926/m.88018 type:complete len:373 (-) Transcript_41926:171-1289(-)